MGRPTHISEHTCMCVSSTQPVHVFAYKTHCRGYAARRRGQPAGDDAAFELVSRQLIAGRLRAGRLADAYTKAGVQNELTERERERERESESTQQSKHSRNRDSDSGSEKDMSETSSLSSMAASSINAARPSSKELPPPQKLQISITST
jgi:hypothetical protein